MNNDNFINGVDDLNNNTTSNPTSSTLNNNLNSISTQSANFSTFTDDELLRAFIGKNYEKITTRTFNFAGFFFKTFYMLYRKMFLYAILLFLVNLVVLNLIDNFIVTLAFNVAVGFLVNRIYLFYAKKKIDKIKIQNKQKDINELKSICSAKGGTSVGKIFLGLLAELGITLVVLFAMFAVGIGGMLGSLFNLSNWNITINGVDNNSISTKAMPKWPVTIKGYHCDDKCYVYIGKSEFSSDYDEYVFDADNYEFFISLVDYSDYVDIIIWHTKKGSENTIVDYKIYFKSNDGEITGKNINAKTEAELRSKLGLYTYGTHTEPLTLKEIGKTGSDISVSMDDGEYYYSEYINYTFVDGKKNEYVMKYVIPKDKSRLNLNETYNITFEVKKNTFGKDEFDIISVN